MVTEALALNLGNSKNIFHYDGPQDKNGCLLYIAGLSVLMSRCILQKGAALLHLKDDFGQEGLEEGIKLLGFSKDYAIQIMSATFRIAPLPLANQIANLGAAKILEIAFLDDEPLKQLGEKGSVYGITIDAIESMSYKEARKALRKSEAEKEKLKQKNESLDKTCTELAQENEKLKDKIEELEGNKSKSNWSEEAKRVLQEISSLLVNIDKEMGRLFELSDEVQQLQELDYSTAQIHARQTLVDASFVIFDRAKAFDNKARSIFPELKPGICGPMGFGFGAEDADYEELPGEAS